MPLELRVHGCAGHLCNVNLAKQATLSELHAAVQAETGVDPKDQALFHGLDELLFDGDVVALDAAKSAEVLLVHSPNQRARSLVNRLCADNLDRIAEQLARIDVRSAQELLAVCKIIYERAVAEPRCGEACADLVLALRREFPEFPAEEAGGRNHTFQRTILLLVQVEFEHLREPNESQVPERGSTAEETALRQMVNMNFIGHLFLRELLAFKVIGLILDELIPNARASPPSSQDIECVLTLLRLVGAKLETSRLRRDGGKSLMSQAACRLRELQRLRGADRRPYYSAELQRQIQDVLDERSKRQAR